MVIEDGKSNGDGFRTYKRRKQTRLTSGSECDEDIKTHVEAAGQLVVRVSLSPFQLIMCTYSTPN